MDLVSENIRFVRIFAGVPLGGGVKRHWRLSTTAIFGDLAGYVTYVTIYATPCRPANDCKMNDLEWLFHDRKRTAKKRVEENASVSFVTTTCLLVYSDY